MCRLLEISRSGFYAARRRPALQAEGVHVGRYRVRRLMHELHLKPAWQRKFAHTTDSRHTLPVAGNRPDRQFSPPAPDRAWACDITYVRTRHGWLYLAPAMPAERVCTALTLRRPARAFRPRQLG